MPTSMLQFSWTYLDWSLKLHLLHHTLSFGSKHELLQATSDLRQLILLKIQLG